jgi:hypothetical protein
MHGWWVLIKQAYHEPIYLSLSQNYRKWRTYQIEGIRSSSIMNKDKNLIGSKITGRIVEPRTLKCQLFPMAERANSSKSKFFDAVACLKIGAAEFSHPLDRSSQVWCHLWLSPLVVNKRPKARCHLWLSSLVVNKRLKQMYVHPLRGNVHISQQPPLGRPSPGALEGGIDIFLSTVVT